MSPSGTHPHTAASPHASLRARLAFLREFLKAPGVVAAVAPSSTALARAMIRGYDFSKATTILEYGPGTGTFTRAILNALPPHWLAAHPDPSPDPSHDPSPDAPPSRGRIIAIEFNGPIAEICRRQFPSVSLHHDTAANVVDICRAERLSPDGTSAADLIISGLGWPSFTDHLRTQILEATARVLKPGAEFRTFGYHVGLLMRGAWHFRAEAQRLFKEVHISPVVWRNLPPAFVYRCIK